MFDPGQGLPMFNGQELLELVKLASYVAVNDYEGEMLCQRTGLSLDQIAKEVKALIVTKGAQGAQIYADGKSIAIPAVRPEKVIDPTGCGDAFRGGLLYGLENKLDWETTGRLASLMGSIKIAHQGPQNHQPPRSEIMARFKDAFGYSF
jgi:adenosine kinase